MPCRHLRPSSGREHTVIFNLFSPVMITWRKPTTATQCPTLFNKWHGIFYMPSRTDTAYSVTSFLTARTECDAVVSYA